ncbi:MAG: hypothetical protein RLZZ507_3411 [Cyanobacteriota bacterium]|jgi:hypothetical protein
MIYISISGFTEDFEKISSLSKSAFEQEGIEADIEFKQLRLDSFKSDLINILQIGVDKAVGVAPLITAIAAVINAAVSVLKFQEDKKSLKQLPNGTQKLSLNIRTSSGTDLELKISGEITDKEISDYLHAVGDVIDKNSSTLELSIKQVNSVFSDLILKTKNIKIMLMKEERIEGGIKCTIEFKSTNILELLASGEDIFYLPTQDIKECYATFELLEKGNILSLYIPQPEDIRCLDKDNLIVKYKIKKLSKFDTIFSDTSFLFCQDH